MTLLFMQIKRDPVSSSYSLGQMEFDRTSLQLRLTVGMTTITLLGVGSIGTWTTWKMRQMLIGEHQTKMTQIANRIEQQLVSIPTSIQPDRWQSTVDAWTQPDLWVAVKTNQGDLITCSKSSAEFAAEAASLPWIQMPTAPTIKAMDNRYMVLQREPLQQAGRPLGELYLAYDITRDYTVLAALDNTLKLATLIALGVIGSLIVLYVRRSFRPLRRMNQLAAAQSQQPWLSPLAPADASKVEELPSEMQGFVQAISGLSTRLSETGARQREFTNSLSHELRTSLSLIQGYLQSTLRRGSNLTPAQQEALEIAASEADRTVQLLRDLLDLGRMNSPTMEYRFSPVVLNDAVSSAIEMVDPEGERTIQIQATESVVAQADANHLNRALIHLLKNAKDYSAADQPIWVNLSRTQDRAILQVRDQGCGIPPADQPRIFEPFYRVEASRCRTTGGIGLGLAIVQALVTGMGGEITVDSELGQGSTFTVKLPLAQEPQTDG